ncbi:MAG: tRNA lysidine(34) synthetase TilS [Candidatus Cloacimonetes bacterium]|nr:tRNA lysidine(34) synthetase TilS [Candidatus Cloacimonadota bacterium]MCK9183916.1 tRNA lysidine(34) synthetase TilS [Candidatus Cloacimonadota bacterium]MCK9584431.1 tRNA lysidine(34) synthetase TilS [Candidatus Cloacimonadota bacterium]
MSLSTDYIKRLMEYLEREQILCTGEKLLLAVSGGADSTAMLYFYHRLRFVLNVTLLAVHVNHQLRGESSDLDEQGVRQLCQKLNIPLIVRTIDLPGDRDLENRAREARFEIFSHIMKSYHFDKVLLAHHKWDLAETVLLNLFRGAGLSGMAGIKPKQGKVLHPLLCFKPEELKDMLVQLQIPWREDASNLQTKFTRNRIRHDLIPLLEKDYNPQLRDKLAEEANILNQADRYISERALRRYKKICLDNSNQRIVLSLPDLLKAPDIEHFYILREAYRQVSGQQQDFFLANLREIQGIFSAAGSKYVSLPHGTFAIKRYQELVFSSNPEEVQPENAEALSIEPERSRAVHMDYRFRFKYLRVLPQDHTEYQGHRAIIDADKIKGGFTIRSRRPGDRFMPLGMQSFKKIKDFFIDEKVAKYDRDLIPIFEDGEKIFWICGHRIDERVRYTKATTRFLMIEAVSLINKQNRAANRKKRGYDEFDEL